ncbi:MAG TPA: hypothetical protein PLL69_05595, partial [Gemmatimonadales bacterium]|nr:hypothetical protein [Gemmatimonadales bacterium]
MTAVSVAEARAAVMAAVRAQPAVRMPLESCQGHVLATDVVAPWPLPRWTAASMDGWAVHSADLEHPGTTLAVAGGGDASDGPPPTLQRGSAWRVATGGRVPEGADSVIRQEDTATTGDKGRQQVTVENLRDLRRNVRPLGGDVAAGAVALAAGTVITPVVIALLASLGEATPMVYRKQRVAILSSGNEVVALDRREDLDSGRRIADANTPMLAALVREGGAVPVL